MLAFLASLALSIGVLHAAWAPELPILTPKLAHLAAHPEYDVVVIGTSRVYRGFVPATFDAEVLALTGRPVRSFNLGVPALTLAEADLVAHQLPASATPRWALLDADISADSPRGDELTRRAVAWHTPAETWLACRHASLDALPTHLRAFALHAFWSGMAAEALRRSWSGDADEEQGYRVEAAGYGARTPTATPRHTQDPRHRSGRKAALSPDPAYRDAMYARIVATLTERGWTPLLLWTPSDPRPASPSGSVPALDMGSRAAHPELYSLEELDAEGHLTEAGAHTATRIVAEEAAGALRAVH